MKPLLRAEKLSKTFGTLAVVREVSFEIQPGEVVGLAGQSGAGKSAVTMLLAGLYAPTSGQVYFEGQRLNWPFNARDLGIEVVHQHPDLAEKLDITANVFLGSEFGWSLSGGLLTVPNRRKMDAEAASILSRLGLELDTLRETVVNLSSERRQLVAIARAMTRSSKLIILDDPAVLLSYRYQQTLLSLVQDWQSEGTAVLFASDNLDRLLAVTDRIVVLRHGRCVSEHRTDEVDREALVADMVGMSDRHQLTPIMWALDGYYRAREQAERLYQRQALLERDLGGKDTVDRQLIDRLAEQIDSLDSANVSLQDAQRRLLRQLEEERKRLAREIHDQVIQDLLGVNYRLEELEAEPGAKELPSGELANIQNSIRDLVGDLRHICGSLRPPTIDSLGLGPALQSYARDWSERTGIDTRLNLAPDLQRLPETIELSIFRILQEGLSNVQRHADATLVEIGLKHTSPRTLMLSIVDDGQGLDEDVDLSSLLSEGHYGLLGISERVALLGGRSHFRNLPDGGLLVQAEIPHPRIKPSE